MDANKTRRHSSSQFYYYFGIAYDGLWSFSKEWRGVGFDRRKTEDKKKTSEKRTRNFKLVVLSLGAFLVGFLFPFLHLLNPTHLLKMSIPTTNSILALAHPILHTVNSMHRPNVFQFILISKLNERKISILIPFRLANGFFFLHLHCNRFQQL